MFSKVQLCRLAAVSALLAGTGCSTLVKNRPVEAPPAVGMSSPKAATPKPTAVETVLPAGEYKVWVSSEPTGAVVVVNGIPVGKTPRAVILPGTPRGFCRDQVSLKVRFIAADAGQMSQTVEDLLTPLDKIPAAVNFTPSGPSRVAR